jgi:hypothetical protein
MKKILLLYLFLFLVVSGCSLIEDNDDNDENLRSLEGKLLLELYEGYEDNQLPSNPVIFLRLKTEKIYECSNFGISSSYNIRGDRIEILVNGIYEPEICLTALGPAVTKYQIGDLKGTFNVTIRSQRFTDEFKLVIDENFIRIEGDGSQNITVKDRYFNRYPERSFVYLCGTTLADTALCRMFIDTVKSVINIQQFEFPETGVIPYPAVSQGYQYNMPAKYFRYENEDDFMRIREIMKSFKDAYIKDKQGIGISVQNWRNVSFFSWVL